MAKDQLKKCFVIAPIGDQGTETRHRSDQVLEHIIKPVAKEYGYVAVRADQISEPGIITSQVIQRLLDDDLVIADLTGRNPNVYYELAVRHAVRKPIVQIIHHDEPIPFDVSPTRTIKFNYQDLDSAAYCREELSKQIQAVEKDPSKVDSPISTAVDQQALSRSDNPMEKSNAEIIAKLENLKSMIIVLLTSFQKWMPSENYLQRSWEISKYLGEMLTPQQIREIFPERAAPAAAPEPIVQKPKKRSTDKKIRPKGAPAESSEH